MSKRLPFTWLASTLLLSACGGGDDATSSPESPFPSTFTLQAKLVNDCGIESGFNDIELLLQDKNWQVLSRHQPDQDGQFSVDVDSSHINYTLVAKHQSSDIESLEVLSFYQVATAQSATYYATHQGLVDNSSCLCQTSDIELNHPRIDSDIRAHSSADFTNIDVLSQTRTRFNQVQTCKPHDQDWPVHSFSVQGKDNNGKPAGFSGFGNGLTDVDGFEIASSIQIANDNYPLTSQQIFDGRAHLLTSAPALQGEILVFDLHDYSEHAVYQGNSVYQFEDSTSIFGTVSVFSQHTVYSRDYNVALDVKPETRQANIDLARLTEIKQDGFYDYSALNDYQMANFTFVYRAKNPQTQLDMPVQWRIFGPIEGQLPIVLGLAHYQDVISADTPIKETHVDLIRSRSRDDYQQYIDYFASGQYQYPLQNISINSEDAFAGDIESYHIRVKLK
ncbi:hypothetical protein QWY77_04445 [Thalassotalea ponticola]|uniref:hypothetical protein n=1 Tax=Thalassotalea ponticola TaxID=1523392 RepID=UPI0025B52B1A|nr:hypothetical protein [Thalassotalea ponticola]MDN3652016.1 hypothetical protein [Thalassotalea ponticola]